MNLCFFSVKPHPHTPHPHILCFALNLFHTPPHPTPQYPHNLPHPTPTHPLPRSRSDPHSASPLLPSLHPPPHPHLPPPPPCVSCLRRHHQRRCAHGEHLPQLGRASATLLCMNPIFVAVESPIPTPHIPHPCFSSARHHQHIRCGHAAASLLPSPHTPHPQPVIFFIRQTPSACGGASSPS